MRAQSQINAERRTREKSTRIEVRLYGDRPEDVALLEWLDAGRGDASRAEAIKAAIRDKVREAKG